MFFRADDRGARHAPAAPRLTPRRPEHLQKLRTQGKSWVGEEEILHWKERTGILEKVEVKGPRVELSLAPAAGLPLKAQEQGKKTGSADPGIPDDHHVEKVWRDNTPGTRASDGRGSEETKAGVVRQTEESPVEGSPHIPDIASEGDGKEASHALPPLSGPEEPLRPDTFDRFLEPVGTHRQGKPDIALS